MIRVKVIGGPDDGKIVESLPDHVRILYLLESENGVKTIEVDRPVRRPWSDGYLATWKTPLLEVGFKAMKWRKLGVTTLADGTMAVRWYGVPRR